MQRWMWYPFATLVAAVLCLETANLLAQGVLQQNPTPQSGQGSTSVPGGSTSQTDPLAQLTPELRDKYNAAVQCFTAQKYADALGIFRQILAQLSPGAAVRLRIAEFAAESAINAGDRDFALDTLKPIEAANANDWQAAAMLARVYAETGQKQQRDTELAHLIDLHTRAVSPQIAKLPQIILERIAIASGSIRVWYSLEPWGQHKTYIFSRVYDQSGQQIFRIALESDDFDQLFFAKEHPDLAARGMRRFSLDGYGQDQKLANGSTSSSHSTFGFYDGQPSYDDIRERIIQIAEGQTKPGIKTEPVAPR